MIKTFSYKLYPSQAQIKTLERWIGVCCWTYNRALESRIKAYKRRKENVTYNAQQALLTAWRSRMDLLRAVPCAFERDALRRVERGMKAFFRRVKAGKEKVGFPRFRSRHRYNSLECLSPAKYLSGDRIRIPNMGTIRCRGRLLPEGTQRALRVIRRATGWYAQIILDDGRQPPEARPVEASVGVDVGLTAFATLSDGRKIDNPRWGRKSAAKLRALQRRVSRRQKGSANRWKAIKVLQRQHERIADQRKYFCHQHSTMLVRNYDLIGVEKLNVKGMVRSRFGKSILDAAWSTFMAQLAVKAAYAGRQVVAVNSRGTSQACPNCGRIKPKSLSERWHSCECGYECERDHAAAQVILARALVVPGATRPRTDPTSDVAPVAPRQAGRLKRVGKLLSAR
jgi:putative transposase